MPWFVAFDFADGTWDIRVVEGLSKASRNGEKLTQDVLGKSIPTYTHSSAVIGCGLKEAKRIANQLRGMPLEQRMRIFREKVENPPSGWF
jgi:hypothetical protein